MSIENKRNLNASPEGNWTAGWEKLPQNHILPPNTSAPCLQSWVCFLDQWAPVQPAPEHTHTTQLYTVHLNFTVCVCVCVLPQSQVLVWRQEASWSGSDPWSPIPGSRTALASCSTNRRWREIKWTCNDWTVNRLMMLALCKYYVINESMWSTVLVWSEYLDRRLVQSFQICSVFSRLRNSVNFLCSRLSIWQKKQTNKKKNTWKKLRRYIRAWMMSSENVQFFLPVNVRWCSGWRDRAPSLRSPQSTSSKTPGPGGPWSCPRAGQGGCRCAVSGTVHVSDKRNKTKKNENVEL